MTESYIVKEVVDNISVEQSHPSWGSFDVLAEYSSNSRWINVPYDLFFKFILLESEALQIYLDKHNFKNWEEIIKDLNELEYDWKVNMVKYMDRYYSKKHFNLLPRLNIDSSLNKFDDDDEDDE